MSLSLMAYAIPALIVLAFLGRTLYRLTLHPLAQFPGPKLAGITGLYDFYFSVIKSGSFHLELQRLHDIYGPIVRIRPNEVHISHPSSYEVIYRTHSELSKAPYYYSAFGVGLSTWGSLANAEHSQRRAALAPFFSRSAILTYESTLRRPAEAICSRLAGAQRSGASVDLERAYRCVSLDASSQIAFGQSFGFLDVEDFAGWFHAGVEDSLRTICAIRHVPVLVPVFNNLPIWAMRLMGEKLSAPMMLKRLAREAAEKALKMGEEKDVGNERMILGEIVKSKNVARYGVVSKKRLEEEALSLIAASADTVGNALTMATFQLLRHPEILKSLKKELREKIPDPNSIPSFAQLEKLPYLTAVIKEALRMSYGLVGRLPRVVPKAGIDIQGYHISGGCVISMSAYMQHNDPSIFPDPRSFNPSRWIHHAGNLPEHAKLDKYLVSFGKGAHGCIGSTFAWAQLYLTLASVHRMFELNLEPISDRDMEFEDRFVGLHHVGAKRVHVRVSL